MKVKLHLNYAGHCLANERHAIRSGQNKVIKFHALWGLIQHPNHGWILFDTGYTRRFYDATKNFPSRIYALATKVSISQDEEVLSQLKQAGISSEDIKFIIVSHFHADHVGGLHDFPSAHIITSKKGLNQVRKMSSLFSFRKGILKGLIPNDLESRASFYEDFNTGKSIPDLGLVYDLFNDESIMIVPLEGHARGQFGLLLSTSKSQYFLVADAAWLHESFEELTLPHPIVRTFIDSWKALVKSLNRIHQFYKNNPETVVVPTHCASTSDKLVSDQIDMDAL